MQGNSPRYGTGSLLWYSSNNGGFPYNRTLEWTSDINTLGTPGLPYNLQLSNGAVLNYINVSNSGPKGILGNLTIDNVPPNTSSLYMDYGMVSSGGALTVMGNVNVAGNLSLGYASGDDLKTEGDLNFLTGYILTTNNRAIYFTKNGTQNIFTPSGNALTLPKIFLGKTGGGTHLKINQDFTASISANGWNVINFTNSTDTLDLNVGRTLIIGQSTYSNAISGPGKFKGSTTSNISLLGVGNAGTFNFVTGFQNLGTFDINRSNGTIGASLGTPVTINSSLNLNAGFLSIGDNDLSLTTGAALGGNTPSASNMVVTGGAGKFVKYFSGPGSYTYPIGDTTGTPEYSPATLSFSGGNYSVKFAAANVTNFRHPQNLTSASYTKRYWNVATTITGYSCNATFNYITPLADVIGTEANIITGGWDGANWYLGNAANTTTHTLSVTGETALKLSYTGGDVFSPTGSLITDYFRSKNPGGNWNAATSWESSPNGTTGWHDATLVPTSSAKGISILNNHSITMNSSGISMTNTSVKTGGTLVLATINPFTLGGSGNQLFVENGGIFLVNVAGSMPAVTNFPTATGLIKTGGKLIAGPLITVGTTFGDNYLNYSSGLFYFGDKAICEWLNTNNTMLSSTNGENYFYPVNNTDVPIFRISALPGFAFGAGAGKNNIFYALLEVNNTTFSLTGGGNRTFTGGIRGINGIVTETATSGPTILDNTYGIPTIDGSLTLNVNNLGIKMSNGATVPPGANVKIQSSGTYSTINKTGGSLLVNGILDVTDMKILNTGVGDVTISSTGIIKQSNANGFYGTLATIVSGTYNLVAGSTVDYNRGGDQAIQSAGTVPYKNLILSNSGIKTPSIAFYPQGMVTIKDNAIFDCRGKTVGDAGTGLTMQDNSVLQVSTTGTDPSMASLPYNLTGGTVQFYNGGATSENIRNEKYQNIEVYGSNVANSGGNISLNPAGTFKVKNGGIFTINDNTIKGVTNGTANVSVDSGGTFKTGNNEGFHGFAATFTNNSSIHSNITNIILLPGSTVEYSRANPPLSSDYQPITVANGLVYQNLKLSGTGNKVAPSDTAILTINGNFTKTTVSNFVHNGGTVLFNGSSPQTYLSVNPIVMLYNMTNNSKNLIINDTLAVLKKLTLTDISTITLNNDMVMKSNDTTTANIAEIVNATIAYTAGRFIVERYIPNHSKAWQFLAVPTKGNTINEAWQEGNAPKVNSKPGYGTIIYSNLPNPAGLGFDSASYSPSMKIYNSATDVFTGVPNTTSIIDNKAGYFLFVRGDRSVRGISQPATSTILRTRGKIYAPGTEAPVPVGVPSGLYTSVANPYASAINFSGLTLTNVNSNYYVYDPQLTTSSYTYYGYGGYRTISGNTSVPSSGNYVDGSIPPIQSGQAFFVDNNTGSPGSVAFPETAKVNGSRSIFRAAGRDGDFTEPDAQLRGNLYVNYNDEHILIDGELTQFQPTYDLGLDGLDARKLMNTAENMGITSNNTTLAIERRPMPLVTDTLFYQLRNMKQKPYRFEFIASKMDISGLEGYVYDQYLKTETSLNMSDTTYIDFNVTGDARSSAPNRFKIYFKPSAGPLPVTFTNVNAYLQNKDVVVVWKTENEKDMNGYTLQASLDGANFKPLTFIKAANNGVGNYAYTDADAVPGYHYYRIQSVDANGKTALTRIVKVWVGSGKHLITIYPNPIRNNEVNLQFEGQAEGAYKARLLNSAGQVLVAKEINFAGGSGNETIQLDQYTAHGVYHLEITQPDGKKVVMKVMR